MAGQGRHVAILMGTRNGAPYLTAQLRSIAAQSHDNWSLWVSDDGSTDDTLACLDAFRNEVGRDRVNVTQGPGQGAARNYLQLLHEAVPHGSFVALSDQDDVWDPRKLEIAVAAIGSDPNRPRAYAAQSIVTDHALQPRGRVWSGLPEPSFGNALVQNLMSGHTTVLTPGAHSIVREFGRPKSITFHDWWIYQVMTGRDVACLFDPTPVVQYRQHGNNILGRGRRLGATLKRIGLTVDGTTGGWLRDHADALWAVRDGLTPEHAKMLERFRDRANQSRVERLRVLREVGARRTTWGANFALDVAILTGRA